MTEINKLNNMAIDELLNYIENNNITLEIKNGAIVNIINTL